MMGQKECKKYIECDVAKEAVYKIIVPEWVRIAFKSCIDDVPAADVRPVVRGKWTKELHPYVGYNQYKCSICGEFSGHDSEGWIWKPNFCPNCGADMREDVKET